MNRPSQHDNALSKKRQLSVINALVIFTLFALILASCNSRKATEEAQFAFDHVVIFTPNTLAEDSLKNSILTFGERLSTTHEHQGTFGHYFIFHNTFIEFLYLGDSVRARENEKRFRSNYTQRWNGGDQVCPFAFGLTLTPFDTSQTTFPLVTYQSLDAPSDEYYLMSAFNTDESQPLLYISAPKRAYVKLDSLSQLDALFEEPVRTDFRNYLTHPSGIKNLTQVVITVPEGVDGGNLEKLSELQEVEVERGNQYALTLVFDNQAQGKERSLSAHFPFLIKY